MSNNNGFLRRQTWGLMTGIALLFVVLGLFVTPGAATSYLEPSTWPDTLLFKVDDARHADMLAANHDLTLERLSPSGIATFAVGPSADVETLLAAGFVYNSLSTIPSRGGPPWQRTRNYIDEQYALDMMETVAAWSLSTGDSDVVVAIIDTGIDIDHPEFLGRISPFSYNAVTETVGLEAVRDDHGHGTMVAGIIAADQTNDVGIAGIIQHVALLVIKANEASEGRFRDSALIEGIYYAVEQGADVINLSLGGTYANPLTEAALQHAAEQGVVVIGAAGNSGTDTPKYPASFETVLSVSAVDASRALAEFSNFGANIVLSAPGADIVTTVRNNGYGTVSGTSFAAPQVSGVVALMLSYLGPMSAEEVQQRLFLTAMDEGEPGWDPLFGFGIVNTLQALSATVVTVSFETFSGTAIDPVLVVTGQALHWPEDPHLSDHVFEGWFLDSAFTEPFPRDAIITESITLYAKFNAAFHTVSFVTDGTPVAAQVVAHGETFEAADSALDEHVFIGWYTDIERTLPYDGEPVMADLTLYAKFEPIVFFEIVWQVDEEVILRQSVEAGTLIEVFFPEKVGHTFDGWYVDIVLSQPFSETQATEDLTLYGQFEPKEYAVVLMDDSAILETVQVRYGTVFEPETPTREAAMFVAWYLDAAFTTRYEAKPIEAALTLYARFAEEVYTVNYFVEGTLYKTLSFASNEAPTLPEPEKRGFTFAGWYHDALLTEPYVQTPRTEDLELFARFDPDEITVVFLDADGSTVLLEVTVLAGSSVSAPPGPVRPEDTHFTYTFREWSEATEAVFENVVIVPLYTKTFIEGSITLNPGVDSLTAGELWEDGGVYVDDDRFVINTTHQIDASTPGKYTVTYHVLLDGDTITKLYRHVRVSRWVEPVDIILNTGITTLPVGSRYVEAGATAGSYSVEVIGTVDTTTPGVYTIVYRVTLNGTVFEAFRYVHVLDTAQFFEPTLGLLGKSRKGSDQYVA